MFGVSVTHRRRRIALLVLTAVLGGTGIGTAWLLRDPLPYFQQRRSSLNSVVESSATFDDAERVFKVGALGVGG